MTTTQPAPIAELIEHLARHEGGALGASPIVLLNGDEAVVTRVTVDALLAKLRDLAAQPRPDKGVSFRVADRSFTLGPVRGWDIRTAHVAIDAEEDAQP